MKKVIKVIVIIFIAILLGALIGAIYWLSGNIEAKPSEEKFVMFDPKVVEL